jgi:hypothetical protein
MNAGRTARDRARAELTQEIKDAARQEQDPRTNWQAVCQTHHQSLS